MREQNLLSKIKKGICNPKLIVDKIKQDRIDSKIKKAYADPEGTAPFPSNIYVGVNSRCNLRCKMCDFGLRDKDKHFYKLLYGEGKELSIESLTNFINDVKGFAPMISITTTEPLLYENLRPFCKIIKNSGSKLSITTNGYLLKDEAEFLSSYADSIWVSLDGPKSVHNEIRGVKDSFEKAYLGIEKIRECKGPKVNINYTISDENYRVLEEFYNEVKDWHVGHITYSHLNFITAEMAEEHNKYHGDLGEVTSSSLSLLNLKKIDSDALYEQIARLSEKSNASFSPNLDKDKLKDFYLDPSAFVTKPVCLVPWKSGQILSNGDVVVMTRCFAKPFGNINEEKFTKIWNNEKYRNFRKILRKHGALKVCSRCCGIL